MSLAADDARRRREAEERLGTQALAGQGYTQGLLDGPMLFQNDPSKDQFLILSLKWSKGGILTWWGPNNSNYVTDIDDAGRYTRDQVEKKASYYNNGDSTRAVPVLEVYEGRIGKVRKVVEGYVADLTLLADPKEPLEDE
jgi:hypothetical protein